MGKAILCIGGNGPDALENLHLEEEYCSCIAAADSGYHLAVSLGLEPTLLFGDMDSIGKVPEHQNLQVHTYPSDKDYTDTELACMLLLKRGIRDLVILGGGEGRVDHTLALFSILGSFSLHMRIRCITRYEQIWFIHQRTLHLSGEQGMRISVFPLPGGRYSTSGLYWEYHGEQYSLSNRSEEGTCSITAETGAAAVIAPHTCRESGE